MAGDWIGALLLWVPRVQGASGSVVSIAGVWLWTHLLISASAPLYTAQPTDCLLSFSHLLQQVVHLRTLCTGTTLSSEVSGVSMETTCTDTCLTSSVCMEASGFSGAVSVDTLALAQECPPLRQRLKALSTYLRCGSTFIIIINYNYYVFLTAVNRVVEVPFFGHCNSSHLLPKKTVKPGICLCAAFKKSGLNQTSFISVLS